MVLSLRRRRAPAVVETLPHADDLPPKWPERDVGPERNRTSKRIGIASLVLVVLASGVAYGYDHISKAQYFPGTRIGGFLIGSRRVDEAEAVLRERFVVPLHRPRC